MAKKDYELAVPEVEKIFEDLTDQEKRVFQLRSKGLTQTAIASVLEISQPMVSKYLTSIKKKMADKAMDIQHFERIGESLTIYESLRMEAERLLRDIGTETKQKIDLLKLQADIRAREDKFLSDVGVIRKAAKEMTVAVKPSNEFLERMAPEGRVYVASHIIESQLTQLEDPVPPEDAIEDADIEDFKDEL